VYLYDNKSRVVLYIQVSQVTMLIQVHFTFSKHMQSQYKLLSVEIVFIAISDATAISDHSPSQNAHSDSKPRPDNPTQVTST
jgi:hypothetical protein